MAIVLLLFFKTLRRELVSQQMRMSQIMRCRGRAARLKNAAAAAAAAGSSTGAVLAPGIDPVTAAALAASGSGDHHGHHSHEYRARLLAATRHALHKVHLPIPSPSPSPELRPPTLMGELPVTCLDESATPLATATLAEYRGEYNAATGAPKKNIFCKRSGCDLVRFTHHTNAVLVASKNKAWDGQRTEHDDERHPRQWTARAGPAKARARQRTAHCSLSATAASCSLVVSA